ncbi:MAG TPA: CbiX/SirB N-terminal domain-containing protein [Opitutaceae bacterium]
MKIALVDNGSLEAAAHANLRSVAAALGRSAGAEAEAVSWKHSNRIPVGELGGRHAWTLAPWVRKRVSEGEREFLFLPFFISPQGAIGSLLRRDLEALRASTGGFDYSFTQGLAEGPVLAQIVASRIREAAAKLKLPSVIIVDHGGPSPASAYVRERVAGEVRATLGAGIGPLVAASMESPDGPEYDFNRPLLAEALAHPGLREVVIAPLFLSPGRHAGPAGDLARIARAAQKDSPQLRCHFAGLVGSHPAAAEFLAGALADALQTGALK